MAVFLIFGVLAIVLVGMGDRKIFTHTSMDSLILKSSAFREGEAIPSKHTCDGENVNPLLEMLNIPETTKSLALIVDDPDATGGVTWNHWLVWNIDPRTQYISEDNMPPGALQGINSFKKNKYGGPCPPKGAPPHRYMFKLYALDTTLELVEGATKENLESAIANHILDETTLMGRYART